MAIPYTVGLIAATGVTTRQASDVVSNAGGRGLLILLNMADVGSGSVTLKIWGRDPVSKSDYLILQGAAVTTNGMTLYRVYPGLTPVANATVSDVLPRDWYVSVEANNANPTTYTVGGVVLA